jgi:hypothetical protein
MFEIWQARQAEARPAGILSERLPYNKSPRTHILAVSDYSLVKEHFCKRPERLSSQLSRSPSQGEGNHNVDSGSVNGLLRNFHFSQTRLQEVNNPSSNPTDRQKTD